MDDLEKLNLSFDNSLAFMNKAVQKGHQAFYINWRNLFLENNEAFAIAQELEFETTNELVTKATPKETQKLNLQEFDLVINRKDPPFEIEYVFMTYILDFATQKTKMLTPPQALRDANEKIFTLNFPQFTPDSLISSQKSEILRFLEKHQKTGIILKPINSKGGDRVFHLTHKDPNKDEIIKYATKNSYCPTFAQEFIEAAKKGDTRVVCINGKAINAFIRKPQAGDFRGNISSGATVEKRQISDKQRQIVEEVGQELINRKIGLAGFDFLGDYLTEVNITSPIVGFTHYPENLDLVIELFENIVNAKI
jgi:glutathione synthase